MIRYAFVVASGLSSLLAVASLIMLIRSYTRADILLPPRNCFIASCDGQLYIATGGGAHPHWELTSTPTDGSFVPRIDLPRIRVSGWKFAELGHFRVMAVRIGDYKLYLDVTSIPWWCLTFGFGILPIVRLSAAVKRRVSTGHMKCVKCGYDLRASKDRCPECGAATCVKQDLATTLS